MINITLAVIGVIQMAIALMMILQGKPWHEQMILGLAWLILARITDIHEKLNG